MSEESAEQAVLIERRDRIMVITLNRPQAMNAINGALSNGLLNAVRELDEDDSLTAGGDHWQWTWVLLGHGLESVCSWRRHWTAYHVHS